VLGKLSAKPLLTRATIAERVEKIAQEIHAFYGCDDFVIVGLMNGVFIFIADLARQFAEPKDIAFLKASSYGKAAQSSGVVELEGLEKIDLHGRRVLLVDDILDTGRTLNKVSQALRDKGAIDVEFCVLLDKVSRHEHNIAARFTGFVIEDLFVVGYGLDYAEKYRNLADVWTVE